MQEVEFSKSELIQYYWQKLKLINDPHIRGNPNAKKDFTVSRSFSFFGYYHKPNQMVIPNAKSSLC